MLPIHVQPFKFIGFASKISYQDPTQDIDNLWERFVSERFFDKIKNKVNDVARVIYKDFDPDSYTMAIGYTVFHFSNVPEGAITEDFPLGVFMKFTVPNDTQHENLGELYSNLGGINQDYWLDAEYHFEDWSPQALAYDQGSEIEVYIGGGGA